jgi:hypothetical protein
MPLQLQTDGAHHLSAALNATALDTIETALAQLPPDRPGQRLTGLGALQIRATGGFCNWTIAPTRYPAPLNGSASRAVFDLIGSDRCSKLFVCSDFLTDR